MPGQLNAAGVQAPIASGMSPAPRFTDDAMPLYLDAAQAAIAGASPDDERWRAMLGASGDEYDVVARAHGSQSMHDAGVDQRETGDRLAAQFLQFGERHRTIGVEADLANLAPFREIAGAAEEGGDPAHVQRAGTQRLNFFILREIFQLKPNGIAHFSLPKSAT